MKDRLLVELLVAAGEAQQEVGIGVLGICRLAEGVVALGIGLLLLVLVIAHVPKAELEGVLAVRPREVVANLVVEIGVAPWPVIDRPIGVWRAREVD